MISCEIGDGAGRKLPPQLRCDRDDAGRVDDLDPDGSTERLGADRVAAERAGIPATTISAANPAGAEHGEAAEQRPAAPKVLLEPRPGGSAGRSPRVARISSGRAAQTIVNAPISATLAQNSVRIGAIISALSRPIAIA